LLYFVSVDLGVYVAYYVTRLERDRLSFSCAASWKTLFLSKSTLGFKTGSYQSNFGRF
jgi:hypothetical protein